MGRSHRIAVALAAFTAGGCALLTGAADLTIGDGASASGGDSGIDGAPGDGGALDGQAADGYVVVSPAPDTAVFFLQSVPGAGDGGARASSPGMALANSGAVRTLGCASSGEAKQFGATPGPGGLGANGVANGPYRYGNLAARAFQAPDAVRGRFVFLDTSAPGPRLLIVDEQSDCASRPALRIDRRDGVADGFEHVMPRFSPDGLRVAYIDWVASQSDVAQVVTVGVDGSNPRVVRSNVDVEADRVLQFAAPSWVSNQELVWLERNSAQANPVPIVLQSRVDKAGAAPTALGSCTALIEQIEVFDRSDKKLVAVVEASQSWSLSAQGGPANISVRDLTAPCTGGTGLTKVKEPGTAARDVAVAPDGVLVAFAWNIATAAPQRKLDSPSHIYLVGTDGAAAPVLCSGEDPGFDDFGPQWLAGGRRIAWMHTAHKTSQESLYVADVVGGRCVNVRPLLAPSSGAAGTRYITGANAGVSCGVAGVGVARPSGIAWVLAGAVGALGLGLRRRRSHLPKKAR